MNHRMVIIKQISSWFKKCSCHNKLKPLHRHFGQNHESLQPIKMSFRVPPIESAVDTQATPIVIMHGLLGSKNNWNSLAKAIQSKLNRKVYVLDARNHGDSPHTSEFSYAHLAADVALFLEDEKITQAHVMGHSMGGRAMMYLALNRPDLTASLIVVDISPVGVSPTMKHMSGLFDAMKSVDLATFASQSMHAVRKSVDKTLAPVIDDAGVRQFIMTNLKQDPSGSVRWQCNLDALQRQFFSHMIEFPLPGQGGRSYDGPTAFIGGGKSDFIKPEDHAGIKALFPRADISYIEGAGHWVHAQKPDLFLNKVVAFYKERS